MNRVAKTMKENLLLGSVVLISAFFTLTVSAAELPEGNLILNGGFEHNLDNDLDPDHWDLVNYAPDGEVRLVQGKSHNGSAAMRLSVPRDGQVIISPGLANSDIPCVEGQKYTLSVWAKTEGEVETVMFVNGKLGTGSYQSPVSFTYIRTRESEDWKRHQCTFTAPEDIQTLSAHISHTKGTIWLDDFRLEASEAVGNAISGRSGLYVESGDGRFVFYREQGFKPVFRIYNETGADWSGPIDMEARQLWTDRSWNLPSSELTIRAAENKLLKLGSLPSDLPYGRYQIGFQARGDGKPLCDMNVEVTYAESPNAALPKFPAAEPAFDPQEMQSVADYYSRLWLSTAPLDEGIRQMERVLFYLAQAGIDAPDQETTDRLRQASKNLNELVATARAAYNEAYGLSFAERKQPKTLDADGQNKRDACLSSAVSKLQQAETEIPVLQAAIAAWLAGPAEALAVKSRPGFMASTVGVSGAESQSYGLDEKGRPNGIIWGLGGGPEYALRLKRWLDFGFLTVYGPSPLPGMRDTGKLAQGHQGYFNDFRYRDLQRVGVKRPLWYITCLGSSGCPGPTLPYFLDKHTNDQDVFLQTSTGVVLGKNLLNIWHPAVREHVRDYCVTQARLAGDDPLLLYQYYSWEYFFNLPGSKEQGGVETGYNLTAKADFRRWLQQKFRSIARLNAAWGSKYSSFEAIQPPPDCLLVPRREATPLTYEFEKWRRESCTAWHELCYRAIKAGDPVHPVGISDINGTGYHYSLAMDIWQITKRATDFIDFHGELFAGLANIIFEHSYARLAGKQQFLNESEWSYSCQSRQQSERQWQATGEVSLWRYMVWGRTVINIYSAEADTYTPPTEMYGQALLDLNQDSTVLRESTKFMKLGMDKSRRYGDILLNTVLATPKIVMLVPSTSVIDCYPAGGATGGWPQNPPMCEIGRLSALLIPGNCDHLYVPEEAIVEDQHDLNQYKAILVPYGTHFPPGLTEALLAYIKQGGWVFCSGPAGVYDHYGRPLNQLLNETLGKCEPAYLSGDEQNWRWALNLKETKQSVTVEAKTNGTPLIVSAKYGQGGVVVATAGFRTPQDNGIYYRLLHQAIGHRTAWCETDKLELVTRISNTGKRYLFALNTSPNKVAEDTVFVEGKFDSLTDLGVGRTFPVASWRQAGVTGFRLRLEPGDSTVIALE